MSATKRPASSFDHDRKRKQERREPGPVSIADTIAQYIQDVTHLPSVLISKVNERESEC